VIQLPSKAACLIVAPSPERLYEQVTTFNWADSGRTTNVMTMIDQALAEQNADPNRVYVTGLSMGGGGTWNMLNRFSDQFAAGVPIAAVLPSGDFDPLRLVDKPTWAFHARDDSVVAKNSSRNTINRILSAASAPTLAFPPDNDTSTTFEYVNDTLQLNYTEWPTGGHGIWGRVYNTTEMYDWMFSQSLSVSPFERISLSGLGETYLLRQWHRRGGDSRGCQLACSLGGGYGGGNSRLGVRPR
jgi:predicted peptidase